MHQSLSLKLCFLISLCKIGIKFSKNLPYCKKSSIIFPEKVISGKSWFLSKLHSLRCYICILLMIFVEEKCWILTFKVGYTILQDTLQLFDLKLEIKLDIHLVDLFCVHSASSVNLVTSC